MKLGIGYWAWAIDGRLAMVFPEFVISLVITVIATGVFLLLVRKTGRRTGLLWLFLLVFLAVWAGEAGFVPSDPRCGAFTG